MTLMEILFLKIVIFFIRMGISESVILPIEQSFIIIQQTLIEYGKPIFHINKEKFSECYIDLYFELYPYISIYKDNLGDSIIGWFWYLLSQSEDDKKVCYNCHK